jgi:hypothetical protein
MSDAELREWARKAIQGNADGQAVANQLLAWGVPLAP